MTTRRQQCNAAPGDRHAESRIAGWHAAVRRQRIQRRAFAISIALNLCLGAAWLLCLGR